MEHVTPLLVDTIGIQADIVQRSSESLAPQRINLAPTTPPVLHHELVADPGTGPDPRPFHAANAALHGVLTAQVYWCVCA